MEYKILVPNNERRICDVSGDRIFQESSREKKKSPCVLCGRVWLGAVAVWNIRTNKHGGITILYTPKIRGRHNIQAVSRLWYSLWYARCSTRSSAGAPNTHKKKTLSILCSMLNNFLGFSARLTGIQSITPRALCMWLVIKNTVQFIFENPTIRKYCTKILQ